MEDRLNDAFTASQNAQQLCTQYQNESRRILKKCREYGSKLENSGRLLLQLEAQFINQSSVLRSILDENEREFIPLSNQVTQQVKRRITIQENLAEVFTQLQNQIIDPGIDISLPHGTSLFHYVDDDIVESLQTDLQTYLTYIQDAQNDSLQSIENLKTRYNTISEEIKIFREEKNESFGLLKFHYGDMPLAFSNTDEITQSYVGQFMQLVEGDLNSLTAIMVSASSLADRISTTRSEYIRGGTGAVLDIQVVAIESSVHQLPVSIAKALESLSRVKKHYGNIKEMYKRCIKPFTRSKALQEQFQALEPLISQGKYNTQMFSKAIIDSYERTDIYCSELENLISWYRLYLVGYTEVLFEIQRRAEEEKRQKAFLEMMQAELNRMEKEETSTREQFLLAHGKYLPPSLCPLALKERSVPYNITPKVEAAPHKLPKLAKEYTRDSIVANK